MDEQYQQSYEKLADEIWTVCTRFDDETVDDVLAMIFVERYRSRFTLNTPALASALWVELLKPELVDLMLDLMLHVNLATLPAEQWRRLESYYLAGKEDR